MDHLDQHSVLSDKQHGFCSKHSTETQLILTTHNLSKSLNNKSQVNMIIMDFSKAFKTVPHNRLLNKLKRYDVNNKTHAWITKFLTCREQRVVVSGEHSPWTHVKSGVPQGTVLSPLLFLIYINDLPNNIHSTVRLFADDCVLYREINNQLDSQELQKDLDELTKWEHDWQMHFNPDKCFVMRLTLTRNIKQFNYTLGNTKLQETDSHSYLGICITKDLNWNKLTYISDNSLSEPHPSIHQTQSPLMPHKHQNNCLHNHSPTTSRILIISMGPPHPDPYQPNRNGPKTRSPFLS